MILDRLIERAVVLRRSGAIEDAVVMMRAEAVIERLVRALDRRTAGIRQGIRRERELRELLQRDETGLAAGLGEVREIARGYRWIPEGAWGSYPHEEQTTGTLRKEIGHCLSLIEETAHAALVESGRRVSTAFHPKPLVLTESPCEPAACEHRALHFMRGYLYLVCVDCHARWMAAKPRFDEVDVTRTGRGQGGPSERRVRETE